MQVEIRSFKTVDATELQSAVLESVGHVGPWLDWCTPRYSLKDARSWIVESIQHWEEGTAYRWVVTSDDSRQILGCVEVNRSTLGDDENVGYMGYWTRRRAADKGVCTRAARLVLEWTFESELFERVDLLVQPENVASIAVAGKLGAKLVSEETREIWYRGKPMTALHFSVTPESFGASEGPPRRRWPLTPKYLSLAPSATCESRASVYDFRRSLKNARA